MQVRSKKTIREALERAEKLGSTDIEEACATVAQALCVPIESVREVAYEPRELVAA